MSVVRGWMPRCSKQQCTAGRHLPYSVCTATAPCSQTAPAGTRPGCARCRAASAPSSATRARCCCQSPPAARGGREGWGQGRVRREADGEARHRGCSGGRGCGGGRAGSTARLASLPQRHSRHPSTRKPESPPHLGVVANHAVHAVPEAGGLHIGHLVSGHEREGGGVGREQGGRGRAGKHSAPPQHSRECSAACAGHHSAADHSRHSRPQQAHQTTARTSGNTRSVALLVSRMTWRSNWVVFRPRACGGTAGAASKHSSWHRGQGEHAKAGAGRWVSPSPPTPPPPSLQSPPRRSSGGRGRSGTS